GEAQRAGRSLARRAKELRPGSVWLAGGETVVKVGSSRARGGRTLEVALAAALELEGETGVSVLAAGAGGRGRGPPAAGAVRARREARGRGGGSGRDPRSRAPAGSGSIRGKRFAATRRTYSSSGSAIS